MTMWAMKKTCMAAAMLGITTIGIAATNPIDRQLRFYNSSVLRVMSWPLIGTACGAPNPANPGFFCMQSDALGSSTFSNVEIATIQVAASSRGRSFICSNLSTTLNYSFINSTDIKQVGMMQVTVRYEIESEVLAGLTRPNGLPFNGKLSPSLTHAFLDQDWIEPSEQAARTQNDSQLDCARGLISYDQLRSQFGLTVEQAELFMQSPMTVRAFATGRTAALRYATYTAVLRMMGD